MPYPDQYPTLSFETVGSVRIVDIASRLPSKAGASYTTRSPWAIRKILVHYHAGGPHGTSNMPTTGANAGIPQSCINTANFAIAHDDPNTKDREGADALGYAYHYDIGYAEHTDAGTDYCFRTQLETNNSWHTGHGQNEMGIAISHMGAMRELSNPKGQFKTPDDGRPSAFQRRVFPIVLKHLQDKHGISNLHVEGHFQHEKPACPGWDIEYWVMQHEDKVRKSGKGFCWPINPDGGNSSAFLSNEAASNIPSAKKLVANNLNGGSGYFPITRRHTWHDGAHLFGTQGQHVHAIHDGWIVGARVNRSPVKDDSGNDFGSANFVLILHEDPGLVDLLDSRTHVAENMVPVPIRYFSLYMHLKPLDFVFDWLSKLTDRDMARFRDATVLDAPALNLSGVALPVKAGDVIGVIDKHNPFAARPATAVAAKSDVYDASKHSVLHFEIFSSSNLVERFDPDTELSKKWTIEDPNANVFADEFAARLEKLTGIPAADLTAYKTAAADADKADPQQQDASVWAQHMTPALNNTFSKLIAKHTSEWQADFDKVLDKRAKDWGLDDAAKKSTKKIVAAFKWWDDVYKTTGSYDKKQTFLPDAALSHHYHPIRMLCWLAGLRRTLDHLPTGGEGADGYPVSTNIYADLPDYQRIKPIHAAAASGATQVLIHAGHIEDRLKGSSIRFANHLKVYEIDSYAKEMNKGTHVAWKLTLKQALDKAVPATTRYKLGNYGWHFENDFAWTTDLV